MASSGLHWPPVTSFFSPFWPQKYAHENRGVKRASHVKYELNLWSRTPSNRLLKDKTASNGLKNSLKVMFEANSRICMKKVTYFFISVQYLMVLDLMEWFRLTPEVKSTLSQTFRWHQHSQDRIGSYGKQPIKNRLGPQKNFYHGKFKIKQGALIQIVN